MASKVPSKKACQNSIGLCRASRWHKGKQGGLHRKNDVSLQQFSTNSDYNGPSSELEDYEQTMLWAASTLCFFGFMRARELMMTGFDPSQHLALNDVATNSQQQLSMMQITLKSLKTDPLRKGVDIMLGTTDDDLYPVKVLFNYLWKKGENQAHSWYTETAHL